MKIGELKYKPVTGAKGLNPSAANQKFQSRVNTIDAVTDAVTSIGGQLADMKNAAEVTEAEKQLLERKNQFRADHFSRTSYTADEAMQYGVDPAGKETVPVWQVLPKVLEQDLRSGISEAALLIRNPRERKEWLAEQETRALDLVGRTIETSAKEGVRHTIETAQMTVKQSQASGDFASAARIIETTPFDPETKQVLLHQNDQLGQLSDVLMLGENGSPAQIESEIARIEAGLESGEGSMDPANAMKALGSLRTDLSRTRKEIDEVEGQKYYAVIRTEDEAEIESAKQSLLSDSYSGPLDEEARYSWINKLDSALSGTRKTEAAAAKVEQFNIGRQFASVNAAITDGIYPELGEMTELKRVAKDLLAQDIPDGLRTKLTDFTEAAIMEPVVTAARQLSIVEQDAQINALLSEGTVGSVDMARRLQKVRDAADRDLKTDSMSYASSLGMPIQPLPAPGTAGFAQSLANRGNIEFAIYDNYGESTGVLTAAEADEYSRWASTAPLSDLQEVSRQVAGALGERSHLFWDQVITAGGGVHAIAGSLDEGVGRDVLLGQDLRTSDYVTPAQLNTYRSDALEAMGYAYGENSLQRRAYADAAVNLFLLEQSRGNTSADIEDLVPEVTGGLVEFNGKAFQPPQPGVESEDIDYWVATMKPEDLPEMRESYAQATLERLQDGGINLIPSSQGRYFLQREDTGLYMTTGGDSPQRAEIAWPGLDAIEARKVDDPRLQHEALSKGYIPPGYTAQSGAE